MKFYPNDQGTKATKRTKLDNIKCYSSNCHKQVYLSKARSAELHGCMHPLSFNRRGTYLTGCVSKQKWTSKGFWIFEKLPGYEEMNLTNWTNRVLVILACMQSFQNQAKPRTLAKKSAYPTAHLIKVTANTLWFLYLSNKHGYLSHPLEPI